ncbi:cyanophycinase [Adhaeribacter sp. BT258]|uniref:Cyanophycinase n=1 Tax=Adhaeribacter terrigena TaxID=2793070 RepID=A0ABS1C6H2_9BACT|nr:cyanophycinase [Adhaeribacter terrigena]MBK0404782.1 cyanophycinase [Adhaeribacter terrigena]
MATKKKNAATGKSDDSDPENAVSTSGIDSKLPAPKGIVIAIGGNENKGDEPELGSNQDENKSFKEYAILQRFVDELKEGKDSPILIIPTASTEPEQAAKDYLKAFKHLKATNLQVADIRNREDARKPEFLEMVENASGFILTGGDQLRLTTCLGGTDFLNILKDRYTRERIVVAGTSAGAMALSTPMIFQGGANDSGFLKGEVRIATGLEFLKDVAIDTHFIARGRIVRMSHMIALNPSAIGLGIEEDTAIVVKDGINMEVIGSGIVTVVDGHTMNYTNLTEIKDGEPITICDMRVHFLSCGQHYNFNKRQQTFA